MQKLRDFCHGCVPGHATHTSNTRRHQLPVIDKDPVFHDLENKARDHSWLGGI